MAQLMNIPVYGLIENMSYVKCPDCGKEIKVFGESHIDEIAEASRRISQPSRKPDSKNHSFAKDGFTYRRAYFEDFDGQYYEIPYQSDIMVLWQQYTMWEK